MTNLKGIDVILYLKNASNIAPKDIQTQLALIIFLLNFYNIINSMKEMGIDKKICYTMYKKYI